MKRILVLNGPNLNLLGTCEPELYGDVSLEQIEKRLRRIAGELGVELTFVQSNHEGALIDAIQGAVGQAEGILLNPGALAHTSIGILDALRGTGIPTVEVHLTNLAAREEFRRESYPARAAIGSVIGFGAESYDWGLCALARELEKGQ